MPAIQTLLLRRNASFLEEWQFLDDRGVPLDLTGATAELQVRLYGAQPGDAKLVLPSVAVPDEGVMVIEPAAGILRVEVHQPTAAALYDELGGGIEAGSPVRGLAYDLRITRIGGLLEILSEGECIIYPGVTIDG